MILFVDACTREASRTRRLAEEVLLCLRSEPVEVLRLSEAEIPAPSEGLLRLRGAVLQTGDASHPYFRWAKQLLWADALVIAAPYWDLSFPSTLKRWIEAVCVAGLTFTYGEDNLPHTHCRLKKVYYVTTAGGPIVSPEYGFGYVACVMKSFFGAKECVQFAAEHLDEKGRDPELILQKALEEIRCYFDEL